jgi:hypothetical protein
MDPVNLTKDKDMGLFLNDDALKLAHDHIKAEEPEYPTEIGIGTTTIVVSRNKNDLIALARINHNGVTYYIGIGR